MHTLIRPMATLAQAIQVLTQKWPRLRSPLERSLHTLVPNPDAYVPTDGTDPFGTLNINGFPVEFTFASHDPSIRYTTEVGGPDCPPEERLEKAIALLAQLGATPLPPDFVNTLHQIQAGRPLKWGAWIGVRQSLDSATKQRYKLYVQVPEPIPPEARSLLHQTLSRTHSPIFWFDPENIKLVALGCPMDGSRIEFYFRFESPQFQWGQTAILLQSIGSLHQQSQLRAALDTLRGHDVAENAAQNTARSALGFPDSTYGFSFSCSLRQPEPPVFSWFACPHPFFGSDPLTRDAVLRMAQVYDWDLSAYEALTQSMTNSSMPHHNAIALIVPPQGPIGMHVSLSPPHPEPLT